MERETRIVSRNSLYIISRKSKKWHARREKPGTMIAILLSELFLSIDDTDDSILQSCLLQIIREESPDATRN